MFFHCDLHVHIGRSGSGRPVKITAARDLTFQNIAIECAERKGIEVVGVVDCASPPVLEDIEGLLESGEMTELEGGGLDFRGQLQIQSSVFHLPFTQVTSRAIHRDYKRHYHPTAIHQPPILF